MSKTLMTIIELTPLPEYAAPVEVRERQVLKALLRRHGLRCTSIRTVPAAAKEATDAR